MIALLVTGELRPGLEEEAKRWFEENLPPLMREVKGFKSYFNGVDPKTRKLVTLTVWETDEDAVAFRNSPQSDKILTECFQRFYASGPALERFVVQVQF